jgi:lambda family phage minor tail protein L
LNKLGDFYDSKFIKFKSRLFIELYEIYKYRVIDKDKEDTDTSIETIRIGSTAINDSTPWVVFDGKTYYAVGVQGEGFDLIGQGAIPTPKLTVSNVGGILTKWLKQSRETGYRLEGTFVKKACYPKTIFRWAGRCQCWS